MRRITWVDEDNPCGPSPGHAGRPVVQYCPFFRLDFLSRGVELTCMTKRGGRRGKHPSVFTHTIMPDLKDYGRLKIFRHEHDLRMTILQSTEYMYYNTSEYCNGYIHS